MALNGNHDDPLIARSEQQPTEAAPPSGGSGPRRKRGPKTAAGKAKVSLNPVTHGLTSVRPILPGECSADWDAFRRAIIDDLAPVGPVATELAEAVAFGFWRRRRLIAYQLAVIDERQNLEPASARLLPHPLDIEKIIRYETHISRQVHQGMHELEAMRAERRGQPSPLVRVDHNGTGTLDAAESA